MKYSIQDYPEIKEQVEVMSIIDLLRAVICPNINVDSESARGTASVFLHPNKLEKAKAKTADINNHRENKALLVSDMEYGAGGAIWGATMFPSLRAVKETGDPKLSYKMGEIAAKEAIAAGYHWTFGPSVDILGKSECPIISNRSAGENPEDHIKYAGAYMRGLQEHGLIATLKHFPGDGYCDYDQHLTTPQNPLSMQEWYNSFGKVYKTLINEGVKAIMPGHISLPAYDDINEEYGIYPPATQSKKLLTNLLKKELGFEGIIVSDAVNMGGFCGFVNIYDGYAKFLEAGGDCLLFVHETEELLNEMKKRIDNNQLTMETLKNRAYRMLCFSKENLKYSESFHEEYNKAEAQKTADIIVDKACKVYRDRKGNLPADIKGKNIAHVVITQNYSTKIISTFTEKLRTVCAQVDEFVSPGCDKILSMVKSGDYDYIICTIGVFTGYGLNTSRLCGSIARNMMGGWTKYDTPCIFVDFGHPYIHKEYEAVIDTLIYTYGYADHTVDAVISRLTGK